MLKPLINEKTLRLVKLSKFTFSSNVRIPKIVVSSQLTKEHKVSILDVNTSRLRGKKKRIGNTRNFKYTPTLYKYIVTLKTGESFPGFEI